MTQEEKQLLLQDLCARLPYGVKVLCSNSYIGEISHIYLTMGLVYLKNVNKTFSIDEIKSYLRPMSSMTEEEFDEFSDIIITVDGGKAVVEEENLHKYIDFCNSHHFDYRGLIEKGLALESPEGMYKEK